jgi:hypothetical protein
MASLVTAAPATASGCGAGQAFSAWQVSICSDARIHKARGGFMHAKAIVAVAARAGLGLALVVPLLWAPIAGADDPTAVGDETVVASLNQPPAGLSCADAAAQASVYFQFVKPPFPVKQLSLYLDGHGVPEGDIDEHWPTVTLKRGLHPGRNTVDVVATGEGGQSFDRRLVVLVGLTPTAEDSAAAMVNCNDTAVTQAVPEAVQSGAASGVVEEEAPAVVEAPPTIIEEGPTYYEGGTVIYEDEPVYYYPAPVYVYNPYPVVALAPWAPIVPFFSFTFFYSHYHPYCPPPAVAYHPYPPGPGPYPPYSGGHGGYAGGGYGGTYQGNGTRPMPPYGGRGPHDPQGPRPYASGWRAPVATNVPARPPGGALARPYAAPAWQPAARPAFHAVDMPTRPLPRPVAMPTFRPQAQFHGLPAPAAPHPVFRGQSAGGGHGAPAGRGGGSVRFNRR